MDKLMKDTLRRLQDLGVDLSNREKGCDLDCTVDLVCLFYRTCSNCTRRTGNELQFHLARDLDLRSVKQEVITA